MKTWSSLLSIARSLPCLRRKKISGDRSESPTGYWTLELAGKGVSLFIVKFWISHQAWSEFKLKGGKHIVRRMKHDYPYIRWQLKLPLCVYTHALTLMCREKGVCMCRTMIAKIHLVCVNDIHWRWSWICSAPFFSPTLYCLIHSCLTLDKGSDLFLLTSVNNLSPGRKQVTSVSGIQSTCFLKRFFKPKPKKIFHSWRNFTSKCTKWKHCGIISKWQWND